MATTAKSYQPKKLLKLPKEMPSNIIIKADPVESDQQQASTSVAVKALSADSKVKIDIKKLPLFKDSDCSKWQLLYLAKLRACHEIADFSEVKKDVELKENKKECLIEIIDLLDENEAPDYVINEKVLTEAIKMISANLFRTFANKANKKSSSVDPDEDEPHLEEAWPHLQLVYELLLKFILTVHLRNDVIAKHISNSFVKQFLALFDSEDPRERDYLKTILHRIYGKFMMLRQYVKQQIMNVLFRVVYEGETHNGLTELLEILSSITQGLATPLRPEHQDFFKKVLVPLHKSKSLQNYNTQLQLCTKNYLDKQILLTIPLIQGLLKFWPITCPAKEVIFINEIEEVLESLGSQAEQKFNEFGPQLLKRLISTSQGMHYQAAERALLLLNSELIQKLIKANMAKAYPIMVKGLLHGSQNQHWNATVTTITYSVIRTYMEMNRDQFEKLTVQAQQEQRQRQQRQKDIGRKWEQMGNRHHVEQMEPLFPLVQYKLPEGYKEYDTPMTDDEYKEHQASQKLSARSSNASSSSHSQKARR